MAKIIKSHDSTKSNIVKMIAHPLVSFRRYWRIGILHKIAVLTVGFVFVSVMAMYGIARWYIASVGDRPLELGFTFVANYARYFGLDPQETLSESLDLGFKRVRLVSYWSVHEPIRGVYNFSELDWQFKMAEERGIPVSLSIGLRQPRWPECHMPDWARDLPREKWYPALKEFMRTTIERYKFNPMLESYQLENEFLLSVFGECPDHDPDRLLDEFNFVRSLDPTKPLIVNRSNNAVPSWPVNEPLGDEIGAAVYKRVWDKTVTNRYFEYPLPAWYYAFLAGGAKLTHGRDTFVHELQAEPWLPDGYDLRTADISEQNRTMDAERLSQRFRYGIDTGMKKIDLWGVEWWYWRYVNGDSSLWDTARLEIDLAHRNSR